MENISELSCYVYFLRHYDDAVRVRLETLRVAVDKRLVVETLIVHDLYVDVEVASYLDGFLHALFYLFPVGFRLVLRYERIEHVCLVVSQGACIDIGLIFHLLKSLLHFLTCRCRHIRAVV